MGPLIGCSHLSRRFCAYVRPSGACCVIAQEQSIQNNVNPKEERTTKQPLHQFKGHWEISVGTKVECCVWAEFRNIITEQRSSIKNDSNASKKGVC